MAGINPAHKMRGLRELSPDLAFEVGMTDATEVHKHKDYSMSVQLSDHLENACQLHDHEDLNQEHCRERITTNACAKAAISKPTAEDSDSDQGSQKYADHNASMYGDMRRFRFLQALQDRASDKTTCRYAKIHAAGSCRCVHRRSGSSPDAAHDADLGKVCKVQTRVAQTNIEGHNEKDICNYTCQVRKSRCETLATT